MKKAVQKSDKGNSNDLIDKNDISEKCITSH